MWSEVTLNLISGRKWKYDIEYVCKCEWNEMKWKKCTQVLTGIHECLIGREDEFEIEKLVCRGKL